MTLLGFHVWEWALLYLGFFAVHSVYVWPQALAAWCLGLGVKRVRVGLGPRLVRFRVRGAACSYAPLPLGASVTVYGDDPEDDAFDREVEEDARCPDCDGPPPAWEGRRPGGLSLAGWLSLYLAGPVALGLFGGLLFAVARARLAYVLAMLGLAAFAFQLLPLFGTNGWHIVQRALQQLRGRPLSAGANLAWFLVCLPISLGLWGWFLYELFTAPYVILKPPYFVEWLSCPCRALPW